MWHALIIIQSMLLLYKKNFVTSIFLKSKSFHVGHHYATWHLSYVDASSNNNNHLKSHEKKILLKKYKKYGGLDQNPYVNKNDT